MYGMSNKQRDRTSELGEVQRGLSGRVARADDEHFLILHRATLADCCAIEDARTHECLESRFAAAVEEIGRLEDLRSAPRSILVIEEEFV